MNGGMFWVVPPPTDTLYSSGLDVLRAPWEPERGWEVAGAPERLVRGKAGLMSAYSHLQS